MASAAASTVAVLGTGLMGRKMAMRLATQGFKVAAWNRDLSKAQACVGCTPCNTAAEAIACSDIILIMLADFTAIHSVLLQEPVAKEALKGKVVLMMATIGPAESKHLAAELVDGAGCSQFVEAPVLGSQPEAEKGTLQIMVGCDTDPTTGPAWSVLKALGTAPRHVGPLGAATAMKLALNQLIAIETVGFSASLGLVQKSGADVSAFMDLLRGSALYAPTFDKKLANYLNHSFASANFPTKHLLKDITLFKQEAEKLGMCTQVQHACEHVARAACERGTLADCDYSSVYEAVLNPHEGQGPSQ